MGYNFNNISIMPLPPSNHSNKLCPDQYLCFLKYIKSKNKWEIINKGYFHHRKKSHRNNECNYVDYVKSRRPFNRFLILILESPHTDEFDTNGNPYGPVHGRTGTQICNNFENCLNNSKTSKFLDVNTEYYVVILNAVQFQTSLGLKPIVKRIRNSVFSYLLEKSDISQRIDYFQDERNNTIFINCCTGGNKGVFRAKINYILKNKGIKPLNGYHPSSWWDTNKQFFWR